MLGYPVLADPLSNVRSGKHARQSVIDAYDAFLRDAAFTEQTVPEVVVRFGAAPTSKPLTQYLQRHAAVPQVVIDGGGAWNDAALRASTMIHADSRRFCERLLMYLTERADYFPLLAGEGAAQQGWLSLWRSVNQHTRQAMAHTIAGFDEAFEGRVFSELATLLPDGALLYASSSMPVRDMDTFFPGTDRSLRVLANRGANGIDGVVSSALGAGAATQRPVVLVIGDLAFYHDLNGLLAAKLHKIRATIVVVNNDGGGIFSFLPQAAYPDHFEQIFGTPIGLDFRHVAALYEASYTLAEHWDAFRTAVTRSLSASAEPKRGLNIIEVRTNRGTNVTLHRRIWAAVAAALPSHRPS
jgi:2-succinyl-5-enolpyruvyl-6-hydroxy-3-cyclohexene-1-carboxylate synthase